jgi:CPA1 family monovalent cation:H+ antiporter
MIEVSHVSRPCEHLEPELHVGPPLDVCSVCVEIGATWVHLRQCLDCGRTLCCDASPNRHATAHFHETGHPTVRSVEPGETWRWCYLDDRYYQPRDAEAGETGE